MASKISKNCDEIDLDSLTISDKIELKSKLTVNQINLVKNKIRSLDKYPLESTKTRNIIMLGRSGSGKSTAIDVLKDICSVPRPQSLFSETVDARFQSFSLDDLEAKIKYTLNIIDTPGVQEVKPMGENSRSDDAILDTIKYCLKNEITKIHTLFIFTSFEQRITALDKSAFKIYLDMFYNPSTNIAFCVTRAEGQDIDWKNNIINDLNKDEYFQNILKKDNVKIFFTGCVNNTRVNSASDITTLFGYYNEIYNMRKDIVKFVFSSSDDGVMLLNLPIICSSKKSMLEIFKHQDEILSQLTNTTELNTGPINNLIDLFISNIDYMIKNEGLLIEQELFDRFQEMKTKMRIITPKMNKDMLIRFTSKIII